MKTMLGNERKTEVSFVDDLLTEEIRCSSCYIASAVKQRETCEFLWTNVCYKQEANKSRSSH